MSKTDCSRREFLKQSSLAGVGASLGMGLSSAVFAAGDNRSRREKVIDIHQHIHFHGRDNGQLLAHQKAMGVSTTILLPAGSPVKRASTHGGDSNGLSVKAGGNEKCFSFAQDHSEGFLFGANEVPDLPGAVSEIEKYLKKGAVVIGESKFGIACDSPEMQKIYALAREYEVPVLMHWQLNRYNLGFDRFHTMLEKFPTVNFLGHAQAWWAHIDEAYTEKESYPKGKVTPGGMTDRLLSDYPNMYGDLSGGSGLNSLLRDEDHTRGFLERHQDKLLFGSDCADPHPRWPECQGAKTIDAIRRLSPGRRVERKLLFKNAKKLFRL